MIDNRVTWLTQEAYDRLQVELADREGPTRHEIKKRIEAAREEGDLRENGGYHAAREEQGKNEARIRQLKHLLEHSRIGAPEADHDEVAPGRVVTVRFPAWDEEETFLLGSREEAAHASIEVYSPTSPLGAAVLWKRVGDTAHYTLANGKQMTVEILKVEPYENGVEPSDSILDAARQAILAAHAGHVLTLGTRGPLPSTGPATDPGILYVFDSEGLGVDVVVANSLGAAVRHLEDPTVAGNMSRSALWAYGDRAVLRHESPVLRVPGTAGRPGHPVVVTSRDRLDGIRRGAGVYRIHKLDHTGAKVEVVYIGRTNDFRRRLVSHEKIPRDSLGNQLWGCPGGVQRIELIYAKDSGQPGVWVAVDLDELEARKIREARLKHEEDPLRFPRVENDTDGKNGPPSRATHVHYFRWTP